MTAPFSSSPGGQTIHNEIQTSGKTSSCDIKTSLLHFESSKYDLIRRAEHQSIITSQLARNTRDANRFLRTVKDRQDDLNICEEGIKTLISNVQFGTSSGHGGDHTGGFTSGGADSEVDRELKQLRSTICRDNKATRKRQNTSFSLQSTESNSNDASFNNNSSCTQFPFPQSNTRGTGFFVQPTHS